MRGLLKILLVALALLPFGAFFYFLSAQRADLDPVVRIERRAPLVPARVRSPSRVHNVLRLAKFSCQDKAALLADRGGQAVVVEVGAFDGADTPAYAAHARVVYSFEATPSKEAQIRRNIGAYADRVQLRMVGVSDRSGTLPLLVPAGEGGSQQDTFGDQRFFMGPGTRTIDVPVVRLDAVVHEHVDALFSDTQGHEWEVVRGAENLIRVHGIDMLHLEFSPNLMRSSGSDPAAFLRYLRDLGYVCFDCDAFGPPPANASRSFDEFASGFGSFHFMHGDHGQWTDILCFAN